MVCLLAGCEENTDLSLQDAQDTSVTVITPDLPNTDPVVDGPGADGPSADGPGTEMPDMDMSFEQPDETSSEPPVIEAPMAQTPVEMPGMEMPSMEMPSMAPGMDMPDMAMPGGPDVSAQIVPGEAVNWSEASSWGDGKLPVAGEVVTIPEGQVMVLDTETPALGGLMINGRLIFKDGTAPALTSEWVLVRGQGSALEIGTEQAPFEGKATITLVGTDETKDVMQMGMGNKFIISAMGGTIDIHGASAGKLSWSQLTQDALAGATSLTLEATPDWVAGDQIGIAPSNWFAEETELVTVTSVSGDTVNFTPELKYDHLARVTEYEGKTLDQRAEVGLLTRNILIQGAPDSLASSYGGHLMVMPNSTIRIQGAEFYRMGQMGHRARYPIHWHLLDRVTGTLMSGAGQYANNNSIHHSFHRAIVIHGTGGVTVNNNVAYDITNHAYVPSEDGDEINNTFIGNVGFLQRSPEPEDFAFAKKVSSGIGSTQGESRSSTFWFRNPNNRMEGNHAAGGIEANGFFFDLRHLSKEMLEYIDASGEGVMPFKDNLAHSFMWPQKMFGQANGYPEVTRGHGFLANLTGRTLKEFTDFTAYKNFSGVWIDGRQGRLTNSIVADNGSGLVFHRAQAEDVVIVGESTIHTPGEKKPAIGRWGPSGAVHIFDEHLKTGSPVLKDITFINHPDRPAIYHTPRWIGADASVEGLKFINTPDRLYLKDFAESGPWVQAESAYLDKDGSLSNSKTPTYIVRRFSSLMQAGDTFDEYSRSNTKPTNEVFKMFIDDVNPVEYFVGDDGQVNKFDRGNYSFDRFFLDREGHTNYAFFNAGAAYSIIWKQDELPANNLELRYEGAVNQPLELSFAYPTVTSFNVAGQSTQAYGSLAQLKQGTTTGYYYNVAQGQLYMKLMGTDNLETLTIASNGGWTNTDSPIMYRKADTVSDFQPGLRYRYYPGEDIEIQAIDEQTPQASGFVLGLDASPRTMDRYGMVYEGYLKIDQSGHYFFTISIDGDADFYIDDIFVTGHRNGRIYKGFRRMAVGDFALEAGLHPIKVVYRQSRTKRPKHLIGLMMRTPEQEDFKLVPDDKFYR